MHALAVGGRSDIGPLRPNNQDSGHAGDDLLLVADGVGGSPGGDLASALMVRTLTGLLRDRSDVSEARCATRSRWRMRGWRTGREHPALKGMATTLTGLVLTPEATFLVHVGDSRPTGGATASWHSRPPTSPGSRCCSTRVGRPGGRASPSDAQHAVALAVRGDQRPGIGADRPHRTAARRSMAAGHRWADQLPTARRLAELMGRVNHRRIWPMTSSSRHGRAARTTSPSWWVTSGPVARRTRPVHRRCRRRIDRARRRVVETQPSPAGLSRLDRRLAVPSTTIQVRSAQPSLGPGRALSPPGPG